MNTKMSCDVSVIMPVYNCILYLAEAVESVLSQTFEEFELVIVDDGSTDGSREMIQRLAAQDQRIKVFLNKSNQGPLASRNIGIGHALGKYIAFLDADDLWLPNKLEVQVRFMQLQGVAFTFHDYRHMSLAGDEVGEVVRGPDTVDFARHHTHRDIGCLTVMINREICQFQGLQFTKYNGEDFYAWSALLRSGWVAKRVPFDLGRYRLVPGSRSANKIKKIFEILKIYWCDEKIPLAKAIYWWCKFLFNAQIKHTFCRPRFERNLIDTIYSDLRMVNTR